MRSKYLTQETKKATYGILVDDFNRYVEREENKMATFREKKFRLEAIETAYEAVESKAKQMLTDWNWETHEETTRTIEQLDEVEQNRYRAYQDFLKELDKLA